jgi:hypothetical protein
VLCTSVERMKFTVQTHDAEILVEGDSSYFVKDGVLTVTDVPRKRKTEYGPGAWLRVESEIEDYNVMDSAH